VKRAVALAEEDGNAVGGLVGDRQILNAISIEVGDHYLAGKPDKHIYVELKAPWFEITDTLPRYDEPGLIKLRSRKSPQ
jgi:hypothetical protein